MPAQSLTSGVAIEIRLMDAVGTHNDDIGRCVTHIGLALEADPVAREGVSVDVVDMAPPIRSPGQLVPDVHGTVPLDYDRASQVANFCRDKQSEHKGCKLTRGLAKWRAYTIIPHCKPFRGNDGAITTLRFSCVGFVIEAYRDADIDLIETDETSVPGVSWERLSLTYPDMNRKSWAGINKRYDLGLDPNTPAFVEDGVEKWRVVLPGHVFHALSRDAIAIEAGPYLPSEDDAAFPHASA